jgi:hypothetical protein
MNDLQLQTYENILARLHKDGEVISELRIQELSLYRDKFQVRRIIIDILDSFEVYWIFLDGSFVKECLPSINLVGVLDGIKMIDLIEFDEFDILVPADCLWVD